ncbi:hypothetical protein K491DRAFT_41771 [Lophiostoma macrostomum CBS 122681]|uniref:Uncharacterized protein n=1 Tax=Lophiostoma macrostomum CBS 122681 TaxID=1314788 RepID=A0A6A6TL18_9PLEO|nr:hypothetical protein K491DRAFT_41771 [Lophiostoma macrostomum CBS 122681]
MRQASRAVLSHADNAGRSCRPRSVLLVFLFDSTCPVETCLERLKFLEPILYLSVCGHVVFAIDESTLISYQAKHGQWLHDLGSH